MLDAEEDTAYIYVFAGVVPALTSVIPTVTGNSMTVREVSERIVSETAHILLIPAATQAKNSFVDPIVA
jgi:hypothetical protein